MSNKKTVLVMGTGFAGQGHAKAFREAGAEIAGIVGRTPSVVAEVAEKMNIPYYGTDWKEALKACQPDIVSIATPGGAHFETILDALEAGCHVYCDKPLAESSERSEELYRKSVEKGVKTAFAASYRYMPEVIHAKRLVAQGVIGEPREVESISHFNLNPDIPFGWSHRIEQGGGRLNNNFTHLLSIITYVLGDTVTAVSGEVRNDMKKAPVVKGVHNFLTRRDFIPENLDDPDLEWGEVNAEWSYTVMAKIESDYPAAQPVSVLFKHGGLVPRFTDDHIVFYGSKGALFVKGHYGAGPLYLYNAKGEWEELPLPEDIAASLPDIEDDTQRNWTHLASLFVKDLNGESVEPYQTFKDGALYQRIIDLIRENRSWTELS
ncbi:MAG: Gfo/Idh/MocA family oxidoreductase [Spirochaetales bacterium]|nr:Gfo/Idh/MocA family oxidoreductase [Spirochaetales bacterium]